MPKTQPQAGMNCSARTIIYMYRESCVGWPGGKSPVCDSRIYCVRQ